MASVTVDGFAEPFDPDGQPYVVFGSRVPALRSFYLAYDIGDPTPGDHQINLICYPNSKLVTPKIFWSGASTCSFVYILAVSNMDCMP